MDKFQDITRSLLAAGSANAADGRSTYFLYTHGSSLMSKEWKVKSFTSQTTIAESVRPNSSAAYLLTKDIEVIVYIDSTSKLRATSFDDESDEWADYPSSTADHAVHPHGNITACLNREGHPIVLFENRHSRLIAFDLDDLNSTIEIPVRILPGSPFWAGFVNDILHVFYISANDRCLHYITNKNQKWNDNSWSSRPFQGTAKQFIVKPNPTGNAIEFEADVLTNEGTFIRIAVNGQWEKLGRVDENGIFISERSVDLCCIEAHNNTLTEGRLGVLLAADPNTIDAVGGPMSATPLATACWSGSLEAVCLLLDNPYRLADPNAISPKNRTPLYYAVSRSPAHRKEMISALLDAGARVDDCGAEDDFNTPLMLAITGPDTDKNVIHELVDRGASLTKKNRHGQTAVMLAEGTGLEPELRPFKERQLQVAGPRSIEKELVNAVVALAMLIVAYFNLGDMVVDILSKVQDMIKLDEEVVSDDD